MELATPVNATMNCALSDEASLLETSNILFCQGREKDALHLLEESSLTENPPDLYLEEADVGPRAFRLPSLSRQCLETSVVYNKAIIHHAHTLSELGWEKFLSDVPRSVNAHKRWASFGVMTPELMAAFVERAGLILVDSVTEAVRRDCITLLRAPEATD